MVSILLSFDGERRNIRVVLWLNYQDALSAERFYELFDSIKMIVSGQRKAKEHRANLYLLC
jgi:hypothetical protein